ncbi:hypothetical protein AQUCO_01100222v1 [Aquilegia coerulea]|uniref:Uncharacterized protein n=1 Tax=Aquilegia coerulea TaxID=218851 RepID=A0A2G5E636_AQUCA|nr:hypothetical protein AQUCO_01100222v1 [Aquilegia coerulea]
MAEKELERTKTFEKRNYVTSNVGRNNNIETHKRFVKSDFISIRIFEEESRVLAEDIINNIPAMPSSLSFIYRVPDRLRAVNCKKYEPRVVSIGPYHREKENLRFTEKHKKWYLCDLITRPTEEKTSFQDIVSAIRCSEAEARKCYAEEINVSSDDFVKMMILDGCFILELLYKYQEYQSKAKAEYKEIHSKDDHDPIFSATWIIRTLQRDLVLLENQLPFIVLESLFKQTRDVTHKNCSLSDLVLNFLHPAIPIKLVQRNDVITGKHMLDLLRNYLLLSTKPMKCGSFPTWNFTQYSATDLREVGVKFQKKKQARDLLDITFTKGVLEIPPFFFGEGMTILLPNLIALEQCHRYYTDQITSYAILLDSLINTKDDVKLLRSKGIIDVMWNEDEKIAYEVNNLCKGVKIDEFYYDGLCSRVNAYCRTDWHRWRATLRRNYFSTPWAILSFIAALVLLLLTFTQTMYSILSF